MIAAKAYAAFPRRRASSASAKGAISSNALDANRDGLESVFIKFAPLSKVQRAIFACDRPNHHCDRQAYLLSSDAARSGRAALVSRLRKSLCQARRPSEVACDSNG